MRDSTTRAAAVINGKTPDPAPRSDLLAKDIPLAGCPVRDEAVFANPY